MKGHPWVAALGVFFVVGPLVGIGVNLARKHDAREFDGVDLALSVGILLASVLAYQRFK